METNNIAASASDRRQLKRRSRDLINDIITALIGLALADKLTESAFLNAFESTVGDAPDREFSRFQRPTYYRFFGFVNADGDSVGHVYLGENASRLPSFDHIKSTCKALKALGIKSDKVPREYPSSWVEILEDILKGISQLRHEKSSAQDNEDSPDVDLAHAQDVLAVTALLHTYGCVALVGKAEATAALARTLAKKATADQWKVTVHKPSDLAQSEDDQLRLERHLKLWMDVFLDLIVTAHTVWDKPRSHSLDKALSDFITVCGPSSINAKEFDTGERDFFEKLRSLRGTSGLWKSFCESLRDHKEPLRSPVLLAAIARIVRVGARNALIVLEDVRDFGATQKIVQALVNPSDQQTISNDLRLLVTSEQPDCLSFIETGERKCTYYLHRNEDADTFDDAIQPGNSASPPDSNASEVAHVDGTLVGVTRGVQATAKLKADSVQFDERPSQSDELNAAGLPPIQQQHIGTTEIALRRRWQLSFGVMVVLLSALLSSVIILDRTAPKPTTSISIPVQLERLTLYVRHGREDEHIDKFPIPTEMNPHSWEPHNIASQDDVKIVGKLSAPSNWSLIWLDPRGRATLASPPHDSGAIVTYPSDDNFVSVNPDDPPGIHALLLTTTSSQEPTMDASLTSRIEPIWKQMITAMLAADRRGPGDLSTSRAVFVETFLARLDAAVFPSTLQGIVWMSTE